MTKIYVKTYGAYVISGKDFAPVNSDAMRRIVFSPNEIHSVSIGALRDGCLIFNNENGVPMEFSIGRKIIGSDERKMIGIVRYQPSENGAALTINSNWRLSQNGLHNREIHTNPDLLRSSMVHIEVSEANVLGRVDLKVDESGFAAMVFSRELLFMKMNGNHTVPRLLGVIDHEKRKAAEEEGPRFFQRWAVDHAWGTE